MSDFMSSDVDAIMKALHRSFLESLDKIFDIIALAGEIALRRVIDRHGFAEIPELKDYEIVKTVSDDAVIFTISVNADGVDDDSKKRIKKENEALFNNEAKNVKSLGDAKKFVSIYMTSPTGRPDRISGMRDARRPAKNVRRRVLDVRKTSVSRKKPGVVTSSGNRAVDHEMAAVAPRDMSVEDRKLRIVLQREIRNTKRKVIFPKDTHQGMVREFKEELIRIIEKNYPSELSRALSRLSLEVL